jgi:hypothetical protein
MNVKNFISNALLEAAIDSRIDSGMVDLYNCVHVEVLAEKMRDGGLSEEQVDQILNEMTINDGKYPDRQAYNKEGWLVTFPSKDYRDAAIKKGTHYISDPTHGKGGMNLYYKKRGKQKRQTQQDRTISEPGQDAGGGPTPPADTTKPGDTMSKADGEPAATGPANSNANPPSPSGGKPSASSENPTDSEELPPATSSATPGGISGGAGVGGGSSAPAPAPTTPSAPAAPMPPPYTDLSIRFAKEKGWTPTLYGEWRNATGETKAVVGLSGEVVPVKHVEREEFKLFAEKNSV